jgi:hypothetical protein
MTWTTHTLAELPALLARLCPDQAFGDYVLSSLVVYRCDQLRPPCIIEYRALDAVWDSPSLHLTWDIPGRCAIRIKLLPPMQLKGCFLRINMHLDHYFVNSVGPLDPALEQVTRILTSVSV